MKQHGAFSVCVTVLSIVLSMVQPVMAEDEPQNVLFINVSGYTGCCWNYEPDMHNAFGTLQALNPNAVYLNLGTEGEAATLIQSGSFDQIWVADISHTGTYPTDWAAIAAWFADLPSKEVICDARFLSSYWGGQYIDHGSKLTQNYYENLRIRGGGLVLATDDQDFHPGINDLMPLLGLNLFTGFFSQSKLPVDTGNPLMNTPNDLGSEIFDDSSTGQVPYGRQPNGLILYSVAWHSGNPDTPGISSTVEGLIGFHINITEPQDDAVFQIGDTVTLSAETDGGDAPFAYAWCSSLDGELGTENPLSVSTLSPGEHVITVTSNDSMNRVDEDSVTITVGDSGGPSSCDLNVIDPDFTIEDSAELDYRLLLPDGVGPVFSEEKGMLVVASTEPSDEVFGRILYRASYGDFEEVAVLSNASAERQILNLFAVAESTVCLVIGDPATKNVSCVVFLHTPFAVSGISSYLLH
ncbi:MAG TPA: hypothetical protein PLG59_05325 [bacterium]|nr:hypothetical protein [bacterium]HQP99557.1 hypothetical protein [bacterium]